MKTYYVYILANSRNTLYIGITNNLLRRVFEHKQKLSKGFTNKYNLDRLVYYEESEDIHSAITREKQLKKWNRQWKIDLITKSNPSFKDLYPELVENNI